MCGKQDTFLLSKMNKDHFVDLSVIAEFKMIKQLTSDVELILRSIKGSDKVLFSQLNQRFALIFVILMFVSGDYR